MATVMVATHPISEGKSDRAARDRRRRRSTSEWVVRSGLALLAFILGAISVAHSLAPAFVDRDPFLAHMLDPGNARIAAQLARVEFLGNATKGAAVTGLARSALRNDPTTVVAAATLGYKAQLDGKPDLARQWLNYAQALSRRDLLTQLWFIEDAVARNEISKALYHYDIALRTTKSAPDLLFPVLATAVSEPTIRIGLVKILSRNPPWSDLFLRFAADNADAHGIADLYRQLIASGIRPSPEALAIAIQRLVNASALDDSWLLYEAVRPGADRRRSRDPNFVIDPMTASIFDWNIVNNGNTMTSIQRGPQGGFLDFAVPQSIGGVLLQQTQILPMGRYKLEGHASGINQPAQSRPYWTLTCGDGRPLGQVVTQLDKLGGSFFGTFIVPDNCPTQVLALNARPSDDISGITGQVDRAQLSPVGKQP